VCVVIYYYKNIYQHVGDVTDVYFFFLFLKNTTTPEKTFSLVLVQTGVVGSEYKLLHLIISLSSRPTHSGAENHQR